MRKASGVMATAMAVVLLASAATLSNIQAAEPEVFVVTGVKAGDFLNMRSGPGVSNAIVGRIPANGQGVVATGEEKKVGSTNWAKVYWVSVGGWVSKAYLLPEGQARKTPPAAAAPESTVPPTPEPPDSTIVVPPPKTPPATKNQPELVLSCVGTEPFWRIDITNSRMSVNMNDGPRYNVPVTFRQTSENNTSIAVIAGEDAANKTQAYMQKVESCSDSMSNLSYPYAITALLNNRQVISGCCKVQ
ncbi:SH3 domain-containing protein [Thiothrix nivea]|uniref:SH3 type 3 domain protein n=1 Tax=Thiothrix nivea (strain ATCC 35100 / DSM 5205 / JP2) TaxID=870187 RepID=A0A656HBA1_THINJ|nr:SH3 domain-containing protein [Thiothrix nivea]EIJ33392.1 SH3 type 3 domain protein [Thiothrix nivea DSM 5205]